jgi:tRNA threonylcarbamoyladenosine biosynthesis protein TsaE
MVKGQTYGDLGKLSPKINQMLKQQLNEPQLQELAAKLARQADKIRIILLKGALGTGKTTFARSYIQALTSPKTLVPSPTFNIIQIYETKVGPLWHVDLYRVEDISEVHEIGLMEAFDQAILLIEWPQKIEHFIRLPFLTIGLEQSNNDLRDVILTGPLKDIANHVIG